VTSDPARRVGAYRTRGNSSPLSAQLPRVLRSHCGHENLGASAKFGVIAKPNQVAGPLDIRVGERSLYDEPVEDVRQKR
jgi:hypothetical protein